METAGSILISGIIDGENAVRLGLSNQHEDFLYDDAGNNKTGNVTSQATVYDGASPVSASDVTWAIVSDQSKTYGVPTSGANVPTLVNGLLTVKALTANTAKVTIKATYPKTNGRDYFAEFTANKRTQDVYNLDIQPNIISYNTSNAFSPTTITIKAHRVSIDGSQADITTFNSDLLYLAAYLKSGSTFAWHTIGTNGTISPAQTVCDANDNILIELRKVKDGATYSVSDPSTYTVEDFQTIDIAKYQNGVDGPAGKDSAVVRFSPSTVFVPADSEGVADVFDMYVDLWLELNGTNIGFDGSPTIVSDPKSIASYDSGEGKILIGISDLTPAEDYEGEVIVSLTKTYGGKTYSATGSLPIVAQIRGENGQSPIHYSLEASINNIHWGDDYAGTSKAFTPTSFNLKLTKYVGNTATVLSTLPNGYYLYYYGYNGDTLKKSGSDTLGAHNVSNYFCYTENQNTFVCDKLECILCTDSTKPASPANAHNVIGDVVVTSTRDIYRMLLPAGTYQSQLYTRDDSTTPLVYDQTSGFYWYLDADSNQTSQGYEAPSNASTCWKRATNNFQVILTQMLFTEFARMGGFIVYNNFFISQYGTLVGNNAEDIKVNAANVNTQYTANKGGVSFTSVPYGWFDGNDPMGETATSGTTYKFRPMKVVNALTGEEWMAEGKVHVDADGNVEVTGVIRATTLYQSFIDYNPLWGSGQYVTEISASELLSDIGGTLPNILWISSRDVESHREDLYTAFEIHLPNPSLYDGHQIEIICSKRAHYTNLNGDESWNPGIYLHLPDSSGHDTIVWSNVQEAESELNILNYQIRLVSVMKNNVQKWFVLDSRDCEFTYQ